MRKVSFFESLCLWEILLFSRNISKNLVRLVETVIHPSAKKRITHFECINLLYFDLIVEHLQTFSKQYMLEDPKTRKQNIGNVPKLALFFVFCSNC